MSGDSMLTDRAERVLQMAVDEAEALGHSHVGTGHIMAALFREGEGIGMAVLAQLGIDLDELSYDRVSAVHWWLMGGPPPTDWEPTGSEEAPHD